MLGNDVDRLAAHLTGDPYAVMVAYNIINALNGMSPSCHYLTEPGVHTGEIDRNSVVFITSSFLT